MNNIKQQIINSLLPFQKIIVIEWATEYYFPKLFNFTKHEIIGEFEELENLGLCKQKNKNNWNYYELNPILLKNETDKNEFNRITNAYSEYYSYTGNLIFQLLENTKTEIRNDAKNWLKIEYFNILHWFYISLNQQITIKLSYYLLNYYLKQNQKENDIISLSKKALRTYKYYDLSKKSEEIIIDFIGINDTVGQAYISKGEYEIAKTYFSDALKLLNTHKNKIDNTNLYKGGFYQNLGIIENNLGNYNKAKEYFKLSLSNFENFEDFSNAGLSYMNIGITELFEKNYKNSRNYLKKALKIFKQNKEEFYIAQTYQNLGILEDYCKRFNTSIKYSLYALDIFQKLDNKAYTAQVFQNMGVVFEQREEYEKSHKNFKKALELFIILNDINNEAQVYRNLGINRYKLKQYEEAKDFMLKAILIFIRLKNIPMIQKILVDISRFSDKLNNLSDLKFIDNEIKKHFSDTEIEFILTKT